MASISSTGIGSGLDVQGLVSQLMAAEKTGVNKLTSQKSTVQTMISTYGQIKSGLSSLQDAARRLADLKQTTTYATSSSDTTKVTATADPTVAAGTYQVAVSQLAQNQRIASGSFASTDTVIGTGSLTITLGTYNSTGNSFTANPDKTPVTVSIGTGKQTLAGVRDAINNANAGVTASIVNDGTGYRLSISGGSTGTVNGFKITAADDDGNNTDTAGLSAVAFDPTAAAGAGKNLTQLQSAQNALLNIDGIAIQKSSNTVNDAIAGLTLNLTDVTTTPVKVGVTRDTTALKAVVNQFVGSYNAAVKLLKDQQAKGATLSSETTPGSLEERLRGFVAASVGNVQLSTVGLSFDKTGVLSLNSSKLESALSADPSVINKLFGTTATTTDSRVTFGSALSSTKAGTYAVNISTAFSLGVNVAGTIDGAATRGLNDSLTSTTGNASGLTLRIAQGATGSLGTVTVSKGIGSTLTDWIDSLNADGGALSNRTTGLTAQSKRIDNSITRENSRLTALQARYTKQFTNLDSMLTSMQGTSSYLSQQLSALSGSKA